MLDRKTTTGAKTTASHDNSMSILQSTTPMLRYRHIMVQKLTILGQEEKDSALSMSYLGIK